MPRNIEYSIRHLSQLCKCAAVSGDISSRSVGVEAAVFGRADEFASLVSAASWARHSSQEKGVIKVAIINTTALLVPKFPMCFQALAQRQTRAAQATFDGSQRQFQNRRHVFIRMALHIEQNQHGALRLWQIGQRALNGAATRVAQGHIGRIGIGGQIFDFQFRGFAVRGFQIGKRQRCALSPGSRIGDDVDGDAMQPRRKRAVATKTRKSFPGAHENILRGVGGVFVVAQIPAAQIENFVLMQNDQRIEGRVVTVLCAANQSRFIVCQALVVRRILRREVRRNASGRRGGRSGRTTGKAPQREKKRVAAKAARGCRKGASSTRCAAAKDATAKDATAKDATARRKKGAFR